MASEKLPDPTKRNFLRKIGGAALAGTGLAVGGAILGEYLIETAKKRRETESTLNPDHDWLNGVLREGKNEREKVRNAIQIRFLESLGDEDFKKISEQRNIKALSTLIDERFAKANKPTPEIQKIYEESKERIIVWFNRFEQQNKNFKRESLTDEDAQQLLKEARDKRIKFLEDWQTVIDKESQKNAPK